MGCANNKLRSGVIGSTSQGTHQLISPTALCSRPCAQQSAKRTPTDAEPHAAPPPANITSLCLHSLLHIPLQSLCRADGSAAGVAPCWGSGSARAIIAPHQHTCHGSPWWRLKINHSELLLFLNVACFFVCLLSNLADHHNVWRGAQERHLLRVARDHQRMEEHLPPRPHPRHRGHLPVLPWISADRLWDPHVPVGSNMEWRRTKLWRR